MGSDYEKVIDDEIEEFRLEIEQLKAENERIKKMIDSAPVAVMDSRDFLGLCAVKEEDFPALYALSGKRVRIIVHDY